MYINNKTPEIHFQGATKTLKKHHFKTEKSISRIFIDYPNSNDIAGSLPYGWLKNIIQLPKEKKTDIIKNIYKLFRETFTDNHNKKELIQISEKFTNTLRELGIIPSSNQIIIKKKNAQGTILTGAYTIKERGKNKTLEPLFIKKFYDNSGKHSANIEGIFAELALGLHLNKLSDNEHILSPYFGDIKAKFMVSKYEITPQNIKIPRALSQEELYCSPSALKSYFEKLNNITNDYTNLNKLLAKYGFEHRDLHDQNVIITRNKCGKLILKLIDLGKIVKNNYKN